MFGNAFYTHVTSSCKIMSNTQKLPVLTSIWCGLNLTWQESVVI